MGHIDKLIAIGGEDLITPTTDILAAAPRDLLRLFQLKNGFFAFESALHVFPIGGRAGVLDLQTWNSDGLWRSSYGGIPPEIIFFAEDVFGGQFCMFGQSVCTMDPETGEIANFARSIEEWAERVLDDFEVTTGFPLAHEWQALHGPIPTGMRLLPITPFVLGGGYEAANLRPVDAVDGMRARGQFSKSLESLPDGAAIKISVEP